MTYTREQLIACLINEYNHLAEEEEMDMTLDEFRVYLQSRTTEQLIDETTTDSTYLTLDDYVKYYSQ